MTNTDHNASKDLLTGCDDPAVARTRAHDVVAGFTDTRDPDGTYWTVQAERAFAALLHAAALTEGCTEDVLADWLCDPDTFTDQITAALARVKPGSTHMFVDGYQFLTRNARTRTALCTVILTAQARAVLAAWERV